MNFRSDVVGQIKSTLSMPEVAERYGFYPNHSGFLQCPFHQGDHSASLKIYPDGDGWYCFGCHRGGDVIDFVRALYNLDFPAAVVRLNADFNLGLTNERPDPRVIAKISRERHEREEAEQITKRYLVALCVEHRRLWEAYITKQPHQNRDGKIIVCIDWVEAVQKLGWVEHEIDSIECLLKAR